ncbi:DUF551 domain-containing protein [Klebsiella aerogenes]|uniref:DUF551 domain-containing protein n=1 Tax=Klebsiella aerogenes TaxID=548 RepID=UPI000735A483|nr:DUF551 domain-containing protein [Klebsiella aerogenes]KTH33821.1 hypothetical protein ASV26_08350 [Klebsiella aerogenes]
MTKSTITRERLEQLANFKGAPVTRQEEQELARIALAAMNGEPVAWVVLEDLTDKAVVSTPAYPYLDDAEEMAHGELVPLYRYAPPAPVVLKDHQIRELVNQLRDIAIEYHGTQQLRERIARVLRAAMLRDEPVTTANKLGNSPVIPDTWIPVSERIPGDEQEVLTINRMGHRFVSFFDKHSGLFFDRLDAPSACCIEHVLVTHWMELPAAPQEVKP